MSEVDALVKQAISAVNAGRKQEAHDLLMRAVDQDERHEDAWLWLSAVVDSTEEQQICLENVLAINPNNARARKGLETLNQKLASQGKGLPEASPPSPPPTSANPFGDPLSGGAAASDDPFGGGSADAFSLPESEPPSSSSPFTEESFDNWLAATAEQPATPDATPSSSVDWGRPDGPTAYGSGRQVDLPSEQEYDDWVQSLNLASDEEQKASASSQPESASAEPMPFVFDGDAPFGDSSFMVDSDAASPAQPADPFGGSSFDDLPSAWGGDAESAAASSPTAETNGLPDFEQSDNVFSAPGASPFVASEEFAEDEPFVAEEADSVFGNTFSFDDEPSPFETTDKNTGGDDDAGWQMPASSADAAAPALAVSHQASAARVADYFQYIPKDIEAKASGDPRELMMVGGVVVLVLLNIISLIGILSAL